MKGGREGRKENRDGSKGGGKEDISLFSKKKKSLRIGNKENKRRGE